MRRDLLVPGTSAMVALRISTSWTASATAAGASAVDLPLGPLDARAYRFGAKAAERSATNNGE
jgi:hypothetical protein